MSSVTVKERPILFSGPMVRAILDGRKTQTRRIMKPQPTAFWNDGRQPVNPPYDRNHDKVIRCPYGQPGEQLWVRETWFCVTGEPGPVTCNYKADFEDDQFAGYWKPSIHMPRWASRITLQIADVRVERLQDISESDAIAEGCQCAGVPASLTNRGAFAKLWESINGTGSWDANPWVWVVEFRKVQP